MRRNELHFIFPWFNLSNLRYVPATMTSSTPESQKSKNKRFQSIFASLLSIIKFRLYPEGRRIPSFLVFPQFSQSKVGEPYLFTPSFQLSTCIFNPRWIFLHTHTRKWHRFTWGENRQQSTGASTRSAKDGKFLTRQLALSVQIEFMPR